MLERKFSSQFRKEMKEFYGDKIHVQLLQDAPRSGKKPYDAFCLKDSEFYALEFKVVKGDTLNKKILTFHQEQSLKEVANTGGYGLIVILFEKHKCITILEIDEGWKRLDKSNKFSELEDKTQRVFIYRTKVYITEKLLKTMWEFNAYF